MADYINEWVQRKQGGVGGGGGVMAGKLEKFGLLILMDQLLLFRF